MTPNPITVSPDDTVEEAALLMLQNTISGLPVVDDQSRVVGILTQSDVFRAFVHITGIQQGGVQFALRLEDRPDVIKEVIDLLRARGARFVSLLTSYAFAREGFQDIYIRVKDMDSEAVAAAKTDLAGRYEVLYVISTEP